MNDHAGWTYQQAVIAASGSKSTYGVDVRRFRSGYVRIPIEWTAANIGFEACERDDVASARGTAVAQEGPPKQVGTYAPVVGATGTRLVVTTVPTGAVTWMRIPPEVFEGLGFLKICSLDTADGTAEVQAAERVLLLALKA